LSCKFEISYLEGRVHSVENDKGRAAATRKEYTEATEQKESYIAFHLSVVMLDDVIIERN
jgi:hypothetical protein